MAKDKQIKKLPDNPTWDNIARLCASTVSQERKDIKNVKNIGGNMIEPTILAFVAIMFAALLTISLTTCVLCNRKLKCMAKRIKRLESILEGGKK